MVRTDAKQKDKRVDVAENWTITAWNVGGISHMLVELQIKRQM
jgi:hypothetical protein